jgi:8-oxo-dGTP diphosphatase
VSAKRTEAVVRAAGGVLTREGEAGVEVLVVHRPRYDDWSFPKGKLDPGETDETAALREVEEETGWRCTLGDELPTRHYEDRHGRPKRVRYWRMEPVERGPFVPNREVDDVRWIPVGEAATLLSYEGDRRLLGALGRPR